MGYASAGRWPLCGADARDHSSDDDFGAKGWLGSHHDAARAGRTSSPTPGELWRPRSTRAPPAAWNRSTARWRTATTGSAWTSRTGQCWPMRHGRRAGPRGHAPRSGPGRVPRRAQCRHRGCGAHRRLSAVPTYVLDGRYGIVGAQPIEVFRQVIAHIEGAEEAR